MEVSIKSLLTTLLDRTYYTSDSFVVYLLKEIDKDQDWLKKVLEKKRGNCIHHVLHFWSMLENLGCDIESYRGVGCPDVTEETYFLKIKRNDDVHLIHPSLRKYIEGYTEATTIVSLDEDKKEKDKKFVVLKESVTKEELQSKAGELKHLEYKIQDISLSFDTASGILSVGSKVKKLSKFSDVEQNRTALAEKLKESPTTSEQFKSLLDQMKIMSESLEGCKYHPGYRDAPDLPTIPVDDSDLHKVILHFKQEGKEIKINKRN